MTKQEIIDCASKMFFSRGIKAVNMDEIASQLGISKRTLYESFDGKKELVAACITNIGEELKTEIDRINRIKDPQAAIEAIYSMLMDDYATFYNLSSSFFSDLNSYPQACAIIEKDREEVQMATKNIYMQGVEAGLLNDNNDFEMLTVMWKCYYQHNINQEPANRVAPKDFARTIKVFLMSLCSSQGKEMISKINT